MWRAKTPVGYYWKTFDIFTQGYVLFGAWNQRRFDAFTIIVRDPRIQRVVPDTQPDEERCDDSWCRQEYLCRADALFFLRLN
jgi:hypothetical protein